MGSCAYLRVFVNERREILNVGRKERNTKCGNVNKRLPYLNEDHFRSRIIPLEMNVNQNQILIIIPLEMNINQNQIFIIIIIVIILLIRIFATRIKTLSKE